MEFKNIIENIRDSFNKNKNKKIKGIPVKSILFDPFSKKIIFQKMNLKSEIKNNFETHAEFLIYKELKNKKIDNYILFISIPPCDECIKLIDKNKPKIVYYITDKCLLRKNNKKYLDKDYIKNYKASSQEEKILIGEIEKFWCLANKSRKK